MKLTIEHSTLNLFRRLLFTCHMRKIQWISRNRSVNLDHDSMNAWSMHETTNIWSHWNFATRVFSLTYIEDSFSMKLNAFISRQDVNTRFFCSHFWYDDVSNNHLHASDSNSVSRIRREMMQNENCDNFANMKCVETWLMNLTCWRKWYECWLELSTKQSQRKVDAAVCSCLMLWNREWMSWKTVLWIEINENVTN